LLKKRSLTRIEKAEKEYGVRVLYAVESASRAWGCESPNSDYDVRFIYAHPKDWYVAVDLEEKREVFVCSSAGSFSNASQTLVDVEFFIPLSIV
jgi:hypothetical protein|tara:strand:+ start:4067 stop:4348 length:282 start_codon:yes stop_codon:yes gene_type:complete